MRVLSLIFGLGFLFLLTSCTQDVQESKGPKNVIIMISDGMGYNHVDVTSIYHTGEKGRLVFEGEEWLKVAQATYPAIMRTSPDTVYAGGYNPREAWENADYLKKDKTDSGAAGTALSTGVKTYNAAIGLGPKGDTLLHLYQYAKQLGKAAGVITSVQISHATPAGFSANNENRRNYSQIAQQQILKGNLDVLMGCGHPYFDDNGQRREPDYRFVGGAELWAQLAANDQRTNFTVDGIDYLLPAAWKLVNDSTTFADLAEGRNLPVRVLGIPEVHSTLQYSRVGEEVVEPYGQPFNTGLPTLEQMTKGAINVLNQNPNGFFLMVEGGAVDWAGHGNHPGRLIEEMDDFVRSVEAVIQWIETYSSWDETLLVVTSDHETGMLWGPAAENTTLTSVVSNGKGVLPEMNWYSGDHTNALVPVYARGKGSEIYRFLADETDPVRGPFIQNTEIPKAVFLLWGKMN